VTCSLRVRMGEAGVRGISRFQAAADQERKWGEEPVLGLGVGDVPTCSGAYWVGGDRCQSKWRYAAREP
jgi:hypothetical protein